MAALHAALQVLGPVDFTALPLDDLSPTLRHVFSQCRLLLDSVPLPPEDSLSATARSRANTATSNASSASEMSTSSARSAPPRPEHAQLQKEWGKPIRLSPKENPLAMTVYKLASKDGRGAWFARRSVHQGLAFSKWKKSLEREFPESLEVQGGPGDGNIRGIGGERLVMKKAVQGLAEIQVYHLSAQFPGPTTPRDFVTLLLTTSNAFSENRGPDAKISASPAPRHYMVISKPCRHPDCPPRDGFIRGEYESIEFIREIPVTSNPRVGRLRASSTSGARKMALAGPVEMSGSDGDVGRPRGRTIGMFDAENRPSLEGRRSSSVDVGREVRDLANPVEWIMITRSDPGGSVPRWMVERGTPAGIVADAGKFLDWACKTEMAEGEDEPGVGEVHAVETNGHLIGVKEKVGIVAVADETGAGDGETVTGDEITGKEDLNKVEEAPTTRDGADGEDGAEMSQSVSSMATGSSFNSAANSGNLMASITSAMEGISSMVPAMLSNRLSGYHGPKEEAEEQESGADQGVDEEVSEEGRPLEELSQTTSMASFATASDGEAEEKSSNTATSHAPSVSASASAPASTQVAEGSQHEREFERLHARRRQLDVQLEKTRQAALQSGGPLSAKDAAALAKAEERHAREVAKQEERYRKEVSKLSARRDKEARKEAERRRKAEERDERARGVRERDELRREVERLRAETAALKTVVGALQRENTLLVMRGRGGSSASLGGRGDSSASLGGKASSSASLVSDERAAAGSVQIGVSTPEGGGGGGV